MQYIAYVTSEVNPTLMKMINKNAQANPFFFYLFVYFLFIFSGQIHKIFRSKMNGLTDNFLLY